MYVEPFVQARVLDRGRRDARCRCAGAAGAQHGLPGGAGRRCAASGATSSAEAAALGVKVATLDALAAILGDGARGQLRSSSRRRGITTSRRSKSSLKSRRAVRRSGRVAQARRDRPRPARGTRRARLAALRNPAGLDLGARTAPEVALSILAEIVQTLPSGTPVRRHRRTADARRSAAAPASAVDPVCGMQVDVATARHTAEVDGVAYYFCCANCRATVPEGPAGLPGAIHDGRCGHPRPLPRARVHRRRGLRDRAADHARAREAAARSKVRPASARPRAPRCSPRCWARG